METITHEQIAHSLNKHLHQKQLGRALKALRGLRPVDVADIFEFLEPETAWQLLAVVPDRAEVYANFEPDRQMLYAYQMPRATLARLVSEMPADERADLYKRLDQDQKDTLLPALAQAEREDIRKLAAYSEIGRAHV